MAKTVDIDNLSVAIADLLRDYGDVVFQATEEGLNAAEKVLIDELKGASPKDSGKFAKSWRSKGKRYKTKRYVGNTKTVTGSKGADIPLSNILEYSSKSPHKGFINRTYQAAIPKMATALVAEIKREV